MLKILRRVCAALIIVSGLAGLSASAASPTGGIIRVKLQPEMARAVGKTARVRAASGDLLTGVTVLDAAARQVKATGLRRMLPYAPKFEEQRARYGLDRWYVVTFDEKTSPAEARRIFANVAGVEVAETVVPMELKEGNGKARRVAAPLKAAGEMPFDDPRLPQQWHYNNTGSAGMTAGADINLFKAWQIATGNPDVVVAIIDGGVDVDHEDLARNMLVNTAEFNGTPGVDDDGNGFVDDIYGFNFCTNNGEIYPHDHGTHVAGTVAAVNNNGKGVAGVAGGDGSATSGIRMISCQIFDPRSGSGEADYAAALVYAAERGATIAQCSWGWDAADYKEQAVLDAIDYFTEMARSPRMVGGLCIFAAGNAGQEGNFYPAAYEKCLAVAAMTSTLGPASYSNYGEWVDVCAPGGLLDYSQAEGVLSTLPDDGYGYMEGTSMATPHVSGIAALVLSKYGSSTFINETLRSQLINSVNDFYSHGSNADYEGKFGSGYIDAVKALNMGDGTAPEAVTDLSVAAGQDYVALSWTIPASSDNVVNNHIIYYSTLPFTASTDVATLSSKTVDTKFFTSGDPYSCEITGLEPMTTYYVAVVAVNRQGQASAMSEVKQIKTNEGPQMTLSDQSLGMSSTAQTPLASTSFTIGNSAEGMLKWSAGTSTSSVRVSSPARPAAAPASPYRGKVAAKAVKRYPAVLAEYDAGDYPTEIFYHEYLKAYIGDVDKTLPNSMAQWFRVDPETYPDGFNLTTLWIEGSHGVNPVIEIYKGDRAISSATLLQRVDYDWFAYNFNIPLKNQLFFAPGEAFWVVVHFEGNQEGYPLGLGYHAGADMTNMAYMSNDLGKTWTELSAALAGSAYEAFGHQVCWAVKARSLNPDWSQALTLEPSEGTVLKDGSQEVTVSADGSRFVNGTYGFNVNITTNEGSGKVTQLPVSYSVAGNAPDIVMPRIVDFGSLLVGQKKTLTIEAYNRGFGKFSGSAYGGLYSGNITTTSAQFEVPQYPQAGFPARATTTFEVTFAPTEAGTHSGAVVFKDYQGREARVLVQGVATDPARLDLDPAVVEAGTLKVGAAASTVSFNVVNTGKYPLEYVFPRYSAETVEGGKASHRFGYTVASTLQGYPAFAYDGNPDLLGATDVAAQFTDDNYVSKPVSLGFAFPYYGKTYEEAYITSYGGIMFAVNDEENFWPPLNPTSSSIKGTGLISAYGSQLMMNPGSKVIYARQDGKFVVKFVNVLASVYAGDYIPVSFHITLSANGDIEMFYDDYYPDNVFQSGSGLFCGINDPAVADPLAVTSADVADYWGTEEPTAENSRFREFGPGTAVKFEAPKASFVTALSAPAGVVAPGESVKIDATLSAGSDLYAGPTFNNLAIVTTDPSPAFSAVRINAVIDGEGLSGVAAVDNADIDFGRVFRTSDIRVPVCVKNTGRNTMTVTGASFAGARMTVGATLPLVIDPGMSKDFIVTVPTDKEGDLSDLLKITTTAGDLEVSIHGTVIGCPQIAMSFDEINETVASGEPLQKTLTVENTGNEELTYALTPDPIASLTVPERADSKVAYTYTAAVDNASAAVEWVDIETNGLGEHNALTYYINHDYIAVDLPFEFPFYGKKYRKMYVYNTGFVSFTERDDNRLWPEPPADFPQGTLFSNIIAPYWGLHSMDETKTAGTYHYVTDNRAIVSFMEYGNTMNIGVCFQLILNADGTFSFCYKAADENARLMGTFGLAGISSEGGTDYIRLADRMINFGNSVRFTPVTTLALAPGAKDNIGFAFDTDRMAGLYQTAFSMATNVPSRESIEIPVALTVTGEAAPEFPAAVSVEHTYGYRSTDQSNPIVGMGACYDAPFEVRNNGTAPFTILSIAVDGPSIYDEWFDEYTQLFQLLVNGPEIDWITGEPTGNYQWQMYDGMTTFTVGRAALQFSVPMMECEQWMTPGEYNVNLTFYYTTGDIYSGEYDVEQAVVPVKFIVTPAPAMTLDKEEIYVRATADDHVSTETVTLGNSGEYRLDYSMYVDPTGVGEQPSEGGDPGIDPMRRVSRAPKMELVRPVDVPAPLRAPVKAGESSTSAYDVPSDVDYRNALYYPASQGSTNAYNYGSNSLTAEYIAATCFTAPAEGFNISQVYTAITIEQARNAQIKVEVIEGEDPSTGTVLAEGSFYIAEQDDPSKGGFYVIPLDHAVFMNPGEKFCVAITYPEGMKYPAYLVNKAEAFVERRYLGYVEDFGWFDVGALFNEQYGSLGYILTCLETVEGSSWIKLLTPGEGAVAVEASHEVRLEVNAAHARLEKGNKAMLVVKTNDPAMPLLNFPVTLDKNGRPVITGPDSRLFVRENDKASASLSVTDPDGDAMTLRFSDVDNLSAATVTADGATLTPADDGTYAVAAGTAEVKVDVEVSADYGDAGEGYAFVLTATDAGNHRAEFVGRYTVEKVNRAPEAAEVKPVTVELEKLTAPIAYADLFTDPDGDEMTFAFEIPENRHVEAYTTPDGVVFYGKAIGTAEATLTATDANGASTTLTIPVEVTAAAGIEGIGAPDSFIALVENPVADMLRVRCGFTAPGALFELYDIAGNRVARATADVSNGDTVAIRVAGLAAGHYLLRVTDGRRSAIARVVKL